MDRIMRWTALGITRESLISSMLITPCYMLIPPCSMLFTPYSMLMTWRCISNSHSNIHRNSIKKFAKYPSSWTWIKTSHRCLKKSDQDVWMMMLYIQFLLMDLFFEFLWIHNWHSSWPHIQTPNQSGYPNYTATWQVQQATPGRSTTESAPAGYADPTAA